ncbi:MAG: right-handed parallel beta-helix repeat-containing protein [Casimicrobiaceae bacterium]
MFEREGGDPDRVSVFAGDGITVSAGALNDVILRGLTINGQGGDNGIRVTSGGKTHIVDCKIQNLGQNGILVEGGDATHVARADLRDNVHQGFYVVPAGAVTIKTSVVDTLVTGNGGAGIFAAATVAASQVDISVLRVTSTGNQSSGFAANTTGVGTITMTVADSEATENGGNGLAILGVNAVGIVSNTALVHNAFADLGQNSATLRTAGNNAITGRGAGDTVGTLTSNPPK